jgi:hypothetical protein
VLCAGKSVTFRFVDRPVVEASSLNTSAVPMTDVVNSTVPIAEVVVRDEASSVHIADVVLVDESNHLPVCSPATTTTSPGPVPLFPSFKGQLCDRRQN